MPTDLLSFVAAWIAHSAAYLAIAGLLFAATRRWGERRLAARRLPVRGRGLDAAQLRHELGYTLIVLALGTAVGLGVRAFAPAPAPAGPGLSLLVALGLLAVNDLWFYGVHRLLHTRWLFQKVHAVHHRSVDVNPLSSYAFHPVEALLLTGWLVPVALWAPLPLPALVAVQAVGLANNLMAHLGYELLPAWWARAPVLRWSNTATFHALHHAKLRGNYGLMTRVWDRLFGTELDGTDAAFAAATGGAAGVQPPPSAPPRSP